MLDFNRLAGDVFLRGALAEAQEFQMPRLKSKSIGELGLHLRTGMPSAPSASQRTSDLGALLLKR